MTMPPEAQRALMTDIMTNATRNVGDVLREYGGRSANRTTYEEQMAKRILQLEELCDDIYTELDNRYDVDTIVDDGSVSYRETPYPGAGEHLERLRAVLGIG